MNETKKQLILDLLKRYKEKFLNVSLEGPYKEGEKADELYKWQLITKCHEKTDAEIIRNFKPINVVHVQTVYPVLTELLKSNQQQLIDCFNGLKDESRSLSERLSIFKKEMGDLCGNKFKSKANDERTAAAFLTCWNPEEYTFFIDTVYQNYCKFIGEQPYETGEKYPHYLQLLPELIEIIKPDAELMNKFQNETKGLIQSDLLIAQNILWQMKDMMTGTRFSFKDFYDAVKSKLGNNGYLLRDYCKGHIWINSVNFEATLEHHYEFNCEDKKKAGHNGGNIYVEIHFEENNSSKYEKALKDIDIIQSFRWINEKKGFRINNEGYEMVGDVDDVAEKAINELYELDRLIGKTIKQTINNMKTNTRIEESTQLLNLKRNIILQGAPGTGKTYNTAALALSICGETIPENHEDVMKRYGELQKEGRIGLCTFHQSMDYEDFVEGIKPNTENGQISYDYEDGIFKRMVVFSKYSFVDNQKKSIVAFKNFDERWNCLIDSINENSSYKFETKKKNKMIVLDVTDNSITLQGESAKKTTTCYKKEMEKLWTVFGDSNLEEIKNFNTEFRKHVGGNETAKYAILKALQDEKIDSNFTQEDNQLDYDKKKELASKLDDEDFKIIPNKNYVLIIDEINRGNVSKIFGELITLLEADKRLGGDHPIKVTLPYSKEPFGVPSNLYIIGTMNTTDRSVGNIDYAVRRRFAFVTLKADKELVKQNSIPTAVELFESVESFLKKYRIDMDFDDLMVGHSYFFAKDENELTLKWQYEILPLLNEYIKDNIVNAKTISSDTSIADFVNTYKPESQSDTIENNE